MMKRWAAMLVLIMCCTALLTGCGSKPVVPVTFSLSGKVTDSSSQGVAGVTLAFSGTTQTATTDSEGRWRKDGLTGSVTVTPAKAGWSFTPSNRTMNRADNAVDFTAELDPVPYSVSGRITNWLTGNGLEDVTLSVNGTAITTTTFYDGTWSLSGLTGTVTITASKSGWSFTPATITCSGAREDADFTAMAPYSGKIAFASTRNGSPNIWTMSANGTGLQQLTTIGINYAPSWSPTGAKIAFQSFRDGHWEIYVMDANGGNQQRLTNSSSTCHKTSPVWSPLGNRIAFTSQCGTAYQELWMMNSDGSGQQIILQSSVGHAGHMAWSPDGTKLAYTLQLGNWQVYVVDLTTWKITQLTHTVVGDNMKPAWAPGDRIVFESDRATLGVRELYTINADGTGETPVTSGSRPLSNTDGAWSPGGTHIVFASPRWTGGRSELFIMDRTGSNVMRMTAPPSGNDAHPVWTY